MSGIFVLDGTGLLIEDIDEIKLEKSITSLIQNKKLLEEMPFLNVTFKIEQDFINKSTSIPLFRLK